MSTTPKRNLPVASEPWGRSVDERIDTIEKTATQNNKDTKNTQSAINSTVTKLSEQVAAIDELTQELAQQQAALAEQQETLEEQQAQLTEQVGQIQALVNSTIYTAPIGITTTGGTIASGNNFATLSSSSVLVPAGYTKATVLVIGTVYGVDTSGVSAPFIWARCLIEVPGDTNTGRANYDLGVPLGGISVTSHTKGTFTGLSAGQAVTVHVQGASGDGANQVAADADGIVLFTR